PQGGNLHRHAQTLAISLDVEQTRQQLFSIGHSYLARAAPTFRVGHNHPARRLSERMKWVT
ncbi:MAG: hypothetical protein ACLGJA_24620, partial [Gammaproteobacteria bacterium]